MGTVALGELLREVKPGFATGDNLQAGTAQLRMNNVTVDGRLDWSRVRRVEPTEKQMATCLLQRGDVVFNATNSAEMVGKSALIRELSEDTLFSNHFLRLRVDDSRLDPGYLAQFLQFEFGRGTFANLAKRWVNQATVGRESLEGVQVPLPPLPEQRRIASILDQASALGVMNETSTELTVSLKSSLFTRTFGQQPQREFDLFPLGDLIDPERPISYGILKPGPETADGVPYIRVTDFSGGRVAVDRVRRTTKAIDHEFRRSRLRAGDMLFSIRGHVGRIAIVPEELEGANITQDTARLALRGVEPHYLREWMASPVAQLWMRQRTKGAAVKGINLSDLRLLPVPIPSREMQSNFSDRIRSINSNLEARQLRARSASELSRSLQNRAFKGEL